jgi:hypothetical protein
MCVILELMFLSFYCDYIVDEITVFLHFFKKVSLKLLIFGGQLRPPKIIMAYFRRGHLPAKNKPLFSASRLLAAENKLFSAGRCQPSNIMAYFRLIFVGGQRPPKIGLKPPKISYFRRQRLLLGTSSQMLRVKNKAT